MTILPCRRATTRYPLVSSLPGPRGEPARAPSVEVSVSRVALVSGRPGASDTPLAAALERRDVEVSSVGWDEPPVDWSRYDAAVIRSTGTPALGRDALLASAQRVGAATALWNPPDVLRWNTHRSYLLELEERGAPVVPTAWTAQGDRVDLGQLLSFRGWSDVVLKAAVPGTAPGVKRVVVAEGPTDMAAGQRHLDTLLTRGDVLVQPYLSGVEVAGRRSVIVVDGQVTHTVRVAAGTGASAGDRDRAVAVEPADADTVALARWVVDAIGVDLLYARVDLVDDDLGNPQVIEVDATAPELYLEVVPTAAEVLADAVLRRVTT